MTAPTCPVCGSSFDARKGRCPSCANHIASGQEARQEIVGAEDVGTTLSCPDPPQEPLGVEEGRPECLSPLLDVPSLHKRIENEEAANRTRAIHRVFHRVTAAFALVGVIGGVSLAVEGKGGEALGAVVVGLCGGAFFGLLAAFCYAILVCPGPDLTGAEELARRRRRAR